MGRGEYVVENADDAPIGHFGLALSNYTHSTAPNRRYPDIISQRQYKAILEQRPSPYSVQELNKLAELCTEKEDDASKAERHLNKSAAAILLEPLIGSRFKGIVTGVTPYGTWIRIFKPPVEGKIIRGFENLDVGDKVTVTLTSVNIHDGFIDFEM
jgi:exoribonuclease-2